MNQTSRSYVKISLFAVFFVVIDQISKYWATMALKGKNDIYLIKNMLRLHYLDGGNTGAAWGIFPGKQILFILFTVLALVVINIFIRNIQALKDTPHQETYRQKKRYTMLQYSLALLMAGAIGNVIDRILHGYVTDFIYFKHTISFGPKIAFHIKIDFPIFNLADCYVTISCIFILFIVFFLLKENDFNCIFTLRKRNTQ